MKKREAQSCCILWAKSIDLINVEDRGYSAEGKLFANAMTKILKYQMGHYCPTCGMNLMPKAKLLGKRK